MTNIAALHESGSLVNLWLPQATQGGAGKTQKVWVGDGFPPIPIKVHDQTPPTNLKQSVRYNDNNQFRNTILYVQCTCIHDIATL